MTKVKVFRLVQDDDVKIWKFYENYCLFFHRNMTQLLYLAKGTSNVVFLLFCNKYLLYKDLTLINDKYNSFEKHILVLTVFNQYFLYEMFTFPCKMKDWNEILICISLLVKSNVWRLNVVYVRLNNFGKKHEYFMHDDRWEVKDFNLLKRNDSAECVEECLSSKDYIYIHYNLYIWYIFIIYIHL